MVLFPDILEHPEDDTPRFVYADWLEEFGQLERGELIRVQCGLARITPLLTEWSYDLSTKVDRLHKRSEDLLEAHGTEWMREIWPGINSDQYKYDHKSGHVVELGVTTIATIAYQRGFIHRIECPMWIWCGLECDSCAGNGIACLGYPGHDIGCKACNGTGRIGAHGPRIVKATPLEHVVLTDKQPSGVQWWYNPSLSYLTTPTVKSHLPAFLFKRLTASFIPSRVGHISYRSVEEAVDALSDACLRWAHD